MLFEEILKSSGLSDKQVDDIKELMAKNKIYITSLENADKRYIKLKRQKEEVDGILESATVRIEELKKDKSSVEYLQKTIEENKNTIKNLKEEALKSSRTYSLKEHLAKVGVADPDYLIYKCGGVDMFEFDKRNNPIGVEKVINQFKEDGMMAYLFNSKSMQYIDSDKAKKIYIEYC